MAKYAMSWQDLYKGRWPGGFTDPPCAEGLLAGGRAFPKWRKGSPPTWAELVSCNKISEAYRRWLVARALQTKQAQLWALDCAESVVYLTGSQRDAVRAVLVDLRAWHADPVSHDICDIRAAAWATDVDQAARPARAVRAAAWATEIAWACAATAAQDASWATTVAWAAAWAADVAQASPKSLLLALPYLEAL